MPPGSARVRVLARNLRIDSVTAEVVAALHGAGHRPILLKGPALGRWLYPDAVRAYGDSDLWVEPGAARAAEEVLGRLGFTRHGRAGHAASWSRNGVSVDLHHRLWGPEASPEEQWAVLTSDTGTLWVGRVEVEVLGIAAAALHVVMHAAQHGAVLSARPVEDLRRLIAALPGERWTEVLEVAEAVGATTPLGFGLRLVPEGAIVADRLGLTHRATPELILRTRGDRSPVVLGGLARARGTFGKLGFVLRTIFPPPYLMRRGYRIAGRGPAGLAVSYLLRPFSLVSVGIRGVVAWARAAAEAARRPGER